ncbi:MAG: hypothetical protein K8H88_25880 [Sandaracinaceae bacterium]|nr:hypothetical protein [Sandaracinaceae bacterium]
MAPIARATEAAPLLELFWEEVGGIVLADFQAYRHALFFRERGIVPSTIGHTTDVVVVEGAGDEWLGYLEGEPGGSRVRKRAPAKCATNMHRLLPTRHRGTVDAASSVEVTARTRICPDARAAPPTSRCSRRPAGRWEPVISETQVTLDLQAHWAVPRARGRKLLERSFPLGKSGGVTPR